MSCRRGSSQNGLYGRHSDKLTASLCNSGPSTLTDDPTTDVSVCSNRLCKNRNCWCLQYVVRPPAARWRFGHVVRFPAARWHSVDWFWRGLNLAGGTDFGTGERFWQEPILLPDFPLFVIGGGGNSSGATFTPHSHTRHDLKLVFCKKKKMCYSCVEGHHDQTAACSV